MATPIKSIDQLYVIARGPFKIYYEGYAVAVTALNRVGPFDILPGHADFFSILSPCEVFIEARDEPVSFVISNGIATVRDDVVMLFVNM